MKLQFDNCDLRSLLTVPGPPRIVRKLPTISQHGQQSNRSGVKGFVAERVSLYGVKRWVSGSRTGHGTEVSSQILVLGTILSDSSNYDVT